MEDLYASKLGLSAFFAFTLIVCSLANDSLVNQKVTTTVDLSSHLPKVSHSIVLENTGNAAVKDFLFAADPVNGNHVAFVGASTKSGDEDSKLTVKEATVPGKKDVKFYRIHLASALNGGKQITVDVDASYTHTLKPYPAEIAQSEKQFVEFSSNLYIYSPYKTKSQTITMNMATSTIESYTKVKPHTQSDNSVTYGPYSDLAPYSEKEVTIHYENNNPFLAVTEMTRLIEVSHWGNIAVEETIDIRHTGAILKGPFSRYDFQRSQDGASSVKALKTVLPASARDVYYRDEIGNISTSNLRELDDMVEVELRPRFPLFGGWKTHYIIGYNVPSYQYLYNSGDHYALKMRFADHVYDDQVIDRITLKVILPEGAGHMDLKAPFTVQRGEDQRMYTYLDTTGRPVVTCHKTNLVDSHVQDFELHYRFGKLLMLREPLLVVAAFYILFLTVIVYVRMDFSITKDEASESRMRVDSLVEQVQAAQDRRSALYQSYDDAINKFKTSKDTASFIAQRKRIDADHKQLTQQIGQFQTKLKGEGADAADKVNELQRLDSSVRDTINTANTYAEKLISGKMVKQQYIDSETALRSKKDEILQKTESLLGSL